MSTSFEFDIVDHFAVGAAGEPGSRVFFLQLRSPVGETVSFKVEKQQVSALAEYLDRLLADLPPVEPAPITETAVTEPVLTEWAIGPMGVAFDEEDDRVVLMTEELVAEEERDDAATLRIGLSRSQATAFIDQARDLVAAGRPLCRLCGGPMDPEGHVCPRLN